MSFRFKSAVDLREAFDRKEKLNEALRKQLDIARGENERLGKENARLRAHIEELQTDLRQYREMAQRDIL